MDPKLNLPFFIEKITQESERKKGFELGQMQCALYHLLNKLV